ncbi:hypothetical protein G7078_10605 [Sphingomonas sinipercae]|uniref:DUF4064 domain-containing protein n=1 Tax=Sphingomonas sinipercae TaxID=2714944 RepID=A0A6G7ZQG5_9SPHN|nr:hypothetical protein [Sphingomonas sinipercae]QIL03183.1 hypothetical protein G7078_10605 [Sphingomonas sinipercae]
MENKRPVSITVIAVFLLISAAFGLYSVLTIESNPLAQDMMRRMSFPMEVYKLNGIVGTLVTAISAFGMLKGRPWSRVLYIGWTIFATIVSLVILPAISLMVMSVIVVAIVAFFLFRPKANAWFGTSGLSLRRDQA